MNFFLEALHQEVVSCLAIKRLKFGMNFSQSRVSFIEEEIW